MLWGQKHFPPKSWVKCIRLRGGQTGKKKRAQKCPFLQSKKRKVEHNILVTHQLNLGSLTKLVSIISSHKYSKVCSNLSCSSLHKHSYTVSWQEDQDPVELQSKPCGCRPHWPVDLSVWSFLVISMQGWVFSGHCGFLSPCIDMQGEVVQLYTSNWPKLWFGPMVNWSTVQSVHPTPPPALTSQLLGSSPSFCS